MKKTCLLIILLLGLTAINSVGYVLLYPGADYIDDPSKFKQKEEDKAFYKTLYGEGKIL